jgi:hypothetical protein
MAYETLMVHLGLGRSNDNLFQVAGELAVRFRAGVIGIAARQPASVGAGEGFVFWDMYNGDNDTVRGEFEVAEAEFRSALAGRVADLAWHSSTMCASIADYIALEAVKADLLIIDAAADMFVSNRRVDACDFAVQLGRPVVIVPLG